MTEQDKYPSKESWGPGPWQDEPDRIEWRSHGLPCLMRRTELGIWCGYVAVPPGHPLHGKDMSDERVSALDAHGGITYADGCRGDICHEPQEGEPADVYWLGFDCAHAWDYSPGLAKTLREAKAYFVAEHPGLQELVGPEFPRGVYRDEAYVRAECESLAAQLMAAGAR